jgi:hypothetical protein
MKIGLINKDINKKADITYLDSNLDLINQYINQCKETFNLVQAFDISFEDDQVESTHLQIINGFQLKRYGTVEYRTIKKVMCDEHHDGLSLMTYEYWLSHKAELKGSDGTNGTNGQDGQKGKDGKNGKDADKNSILDIFNTAANTGELVAIGALYNFISTIQGQVAGLELAVGGVTSLVSGQATTIFGMQAQITSIRLDLGELRAQLGIQRVPQIPDVPDVPDVPGGGGVPDAPGGGGLEPFDPVEPGDPQFDPNDPHGVDPPP